MNLRTERYFRKKGYKIIIGIDEAGRGPLAGPVTTAAVMIDFNHFLKNASSEERRKFRRILRITKDSKKLSPKNRKLIFQLAQTISFIKFSYSSVGPKVIDKINIERATKKAMKNCLQKLNLSPRFYSKSILLIDGNKILDRNLPFRQKTIVKGDNKIFSIALASIIAKYIRDQKIIRLANRFPQYKFEKHKGYGTQLHLHLLKKYGVCPLHRRSYKPIYNLLSN